MASQQHQLACDFINNTKAKMGVTLEIHTAEGHKNADNAGRDFVRFEGGGIIAWVDEFPLTPKQKIKTLIQLKTFKSQMDNVNASGLF